MKFLHTSAVIAKNLIEAPIVISGYYQWHRAFGTKMTRYVDAKGTFGDYDIVYNCLTKADLWGRIPQKIRAELGPDSQTKFVISVDHGVELWQCNFELDWLRDAMMAADVVFGADPAIVSYLRALGVEHAFLMTHPVDVDSLRKIRKEPEQRKERIACPVHRYDNNWVAPYLAVRDLPWPSSAVYLSGDMPDTLSAYWSDYRGPMSFYDFMHWLSQFHCMVDSYHNVHSMGRIGAEAACLGVPCIGTSHSYSQKILWPALTVDSGDVFGQKKLVRRLFEEPAFYQSCLQRADENLERYTHRAKVKEFIENVDKHGVKR